MNQQTGKWMIIVGIIFILIGIIVYFFHDKLNWFGRLPGDVKIENGNFRFYFPLVTMITISVVLTIIINLLKRFF